MRGIGTAAAKLLMDVFETEIGAWRGARPVETFLWVHGILAGWTLMGLTMLAMLQRRPAIEQILLMAFAAHSVWIVTALWRASAGEPPNSQALARALGTAWALNSAFLVFFLEIDLAVTWAMQS